MPSDSKQNAALEQKREETEFKTASLIGNFHPYNNLLIDSYVLIY